MSSSVKDYLGSGLRHRSGFRRGCWGLADSGHIRSAGFQPAKEGDDNLYCRQDACATLDSRLRGKDGKGGWR